MKAPIRRLVTKRQFVIIKYADCSFGNDFFQKLGNEWQVRDWTIVCKVVRIKIRLVENRRNNLFLESHRYLARTEWQVEHVHQNGARSVAHSFNNHVGIRSSSHCLLGASAIKRHNSFTDVPVKACSSFDDFYVIGGGSAVAVDARIFFTFPLNNLAK